MGWLLAASAPITGNAAPNRAPGGDGKVNPAPAARADMPSFLLDAPSAPSDGHLLRAWYASADEESLTELVRRHAPAMRAAARRAVAAPADADDAVQIALAELIRRGRALPADASVGGWLHTVTVRVASKLNRTRSRRLARERRLLAERPTATEAVDFDRIARQSKLAVLDEELAALPSGWREPLVLKYLSGLSTAECAARLGLSVSATEGRLKRARNALRSKLVRRGVSLAVLVAAASETQAASAADPVALTQSAHALATTPAPPAASASAPIPLPQSKWMTMTATLKATAAAAALMLLPGAGGAGASGGFAVVPVPLAVAVITEADEPIDKPIDTEVEPARGPSVEAVVAPAARPQPPTDEPKMAGDPKDEPSRTTRWIETATDMFERNLATLRIERAKLSQTMGNRHPKVVAVDRQIAYVEKLLGDARRSAAKPAADSTGSEGGAKGGVDAATSGGPAASPGERVSPEGRDEAAPAGFVFAADGLPYRPNGFTVVDLLRVIDLAERPRAVEMVPLSPDSPRRDDPPVLGVEQVSRLLRGLLDEHREVPGFRRDVMVVSSGSDQGDEPSERHVLEVSGELSDANREAIDRDLATVRRFAAALSERSGALSDREAQRLLSLQRVIRATTQAIANAADPEKPLTFVGAAPVLIDSPGARVRSRSGPAGELERAETLSKSVREAGATETAGSDRPQVVDPLTIDGFPIDLVNPSLVDLARLVDIADQPRPLTVESTDLDSDASRVRRDVQKVETLSAEQAAGFVDERLQSIRRRIRDLGDGDSAPTFQPEANSSSAGQTHWSIQQYGPLTELERAMIAADREIVAAAIRSLSAPSAFDAFQTADDSTPAMRASLKRVIRTVDRILAMNEADEAIAAGNSAADVDRVTATSSDRVESPAASPHTDVAVADPPFGLTVAWDGDWWRVEGIDKGTPLEPHAGLIVGAHIVSLAGPTAKDGPRTGPIPRRLATHAAAGETVTLRLLQLPTQTLTTFIIGPWGVSHQGTETAQLAPSDDGPDGEIQWRLIAKTDGRFPRVPYGVVLDSGGAIGKFVFVQAKPRPAGTMAPPPEPDANAGTVSFVVTVVQRIPDSLRSVLPPMRTGRSKLVAINGRPAMPGRADDRNRLASIAAMLPPPDQPLRLLLEVHPPGDDFGAPGHDPSRGIRFQEITIPAAARDDLAVLEMVAVAPAGADLNFDMQQMGGDPFSLDLDFERASETAPRPHRGRDVPSDPFDARAR